VQAEWARGWMKGVGVGRVSEIYPLHFRGIYIRGTLGSQPLRIIACLGTLHSIIAKQSMHAITNFSSIDFQSFTAATHSIISIYTYVFYRRCLQIIYIALKKKSLPPTIESHILE